MSTIKKDEVPASLSSLVATAETLKNRMEYEKAKRLYEKALALEPGEAFLVQRLALLTYKAPQPGTWKSLSKAWEILLPLKPERTRDTETLGLAGSVFKRMYEATEEPFMLDRSLDFYKKGFEEGDYYNGINLAYIYLHKAVLEKEKAKAKKHLAEAERVNTDVISICTMLMDSDEFENRNDREFIYQSLTQAYLGMKQNREVLKLIPTINEVSKGNFDLDTFHEQNNKLVEVINRCKNI